MTNAEKYLKDGVDLCELIRNIADYKPKLETSDNVYAKMQEFFNAPVKLTLTEDERVILRNIAYGSEYKYIYRSLGMLYLSENEKLTCVDRLPAMHHLFQFIKERRRI